MALKAPELIFIFSYPPFAASLTFPLFLEICYGLRAFNRLVFDFITLRIF